MIDLFKHKIIFGLGQGRELSYLDESIKIRDDALGGSDLFKWRPFLVDPGVVLSTTAQDVN